jgi:hypothetical protein
VLTFDAVEEICDSRQTTLVVHPIVRQAIRGYEESFYVGLRAFLSGENDLFFLPLSNGEFVRLIFSNRVSSGGHRLVRVEPLHVDAMMRIRASLGPAAGDRHG